MDRRIFKSAEIGVRHGEQVGHPHNCAELYISLLGSTTDVVNGQETRTLPLDVFVLTKDVIHGQKNTAEYRYRIFKFDMEELILRLGEAAMLPGFQSVFVIDPALRRDGVGGENLQIDPLTAEYADATARVLREIGECELADGLFVSLVRLVASRVRPRGEGQSEERAAKEAVLYMNTRYAEPITLRTLAAASGYSERHLSRIFGRLVGVPPMRYLTETRLGRAAQLLSEGRLSVTEIAAAVGVGDSSKFSKRFRQKFGMTPTEYRKRALRE